MSNSSAEQIYSITLDDTISTSILTDTITLSPSYGAVPSYSTAMGTYTISTGASSTFTTGAGSSTFTIDPTTFSWNDEEWVNAFPQWARIEDMCKQYPGLKIAFEKFKTTYKLVKDDYDTPKDKK